MKIYGVAILAGCFLIGHIAGDSLGHLFGMNGNLGGVGFAMLLLIFFNDYAKRKGLLKAETENGMLFWSNMYIPVVVAMSATQNVKAALSGGWVALLVGVFATIACFLVVPAIIKLADSKTSKNKND
jgi:malonate transporter MadL subunit